MGIISPIPTNPDGSTRQTGSLQTLGKDDFLKLLVTKLQYQDPLKPMDDENFVAQLAQFSSLEQMNNIATGINNSTQYSFLQTQSLNNVMASGLIGREVKADYSGVYVDGENDPKIAFSTDRYAASVEFVVRDADGNEVARLNQDNVEVGSHMIAWDGKDQQGNTVSEGFYKVEATAKDADGSSFTPKLSLVGVVRNVLYRDGGAYLNVNGLEIALGDIQAIGEPGAFSEEN